MVVVEEEPLVGGDADPVPTPHLTLELAGGPAGVSEDEERAPGALAPAHRLQNLGVRRERDAVLDDARRGACVVLGVQDEHARWLHRSAVVHRMRPLTPWLSTPNRARKSASATSATGRLTTRPVAPLASCWNI